MARAKRDNVVDIRQGRRKRNGASTKTLAAATMPVPELDLSYLEASTIITRNSKTIQLWLIGCGGSGSFLARNVARLAAVLGEAGYIVKVFFVDHDVVEEGNVPRSDFRHSDIGMKKAQALALRFNTAWGLSIVAISRKFHPSLLWQAGEEDALTILVGAVDNPAARRSINRALKQQRELEGAIPKTWWLDCGNDRDTGQVLLGSATTCKELRGAFASETLCHILPSPAMQHPELLKSEIEDKTRHRRRLSCLQLMLMQEQSLMINQRVAAEAGEVLMQLLLSRDLQRFATYFDLKAGVSHSAYSTPESVARCVGRRNYGFLLEENAQGGEWDGDVMEEAA